MSGVTIYEFGTVVAQGAGGGDTEVPSSVFDWLEWLCLWSTEQGGAVWLRLTQRRGRRAIQVTSFVGVIRAPDGFQIEVLPKVGQVIGGGAVEARQLLIDMLCCLRRFRHIQTDSAKLAATKMPLLEVFIGEYLQAVEQVVKRGLRSQYTARQDNLFALRGKLLFGQHLRQNVYRADRFFTEHDEFSTNRPENRLLHKALRRVLALSASQANQKLARELCFVFADVPESIQPARDFQLVLLERGMGSYANALAWAQLILEEESPLTGVGKNHAPSLLFPMEALFEAFVSKHLPKQLIGSLTLKTQAHSHHLVSHNKQKWFRLKPDLLVREGASDLIVLDTKWKLLDGSKANGTDKYGLAQADFYQLHAYGQGYLGGKGDVVLIYPKTENFKHPLPVFDFHQKRGLSLWVLPFCLKTKTLAVPVDAPFARAFTRPAS
ncbi:2-keto-D-gluconate dehydrogenase [Pseudomonas fluorescens]|uniref:McrC family protein n=1 Tax=Pseudomonas TaxID=286 RepID=UPI0007098D3C|nr:MULTISPECIES: McrC family protein [Pseudomonas]OOQ44575.1 2-keto-D-gluconate dehydrogenase [Pseudomonas fluorescens]